MQGTAFLDQLLHKWKKSIKDYWVWAFASTFVVGFVAYGFLVTNRFLTYDSMWNMYSDQNMITSGRQFLGWACSLGSYYDLPWLNGCLALLYLAITSVLVVEGLGIRSKLGAALAAGLIVSFPSVISSFCYTFTVDGYMLAALLATIAFALADKKGWWWIPGAVIMGVSLGIYQAFLSFAMVLCILRLLLDIIEQKSVKEWAAKVFRYCGMGACGYGVYLVSLNIMLKLTGNSLSGYQGTDNIGKFSMSQLPAGLLASFKNFKDFALYGNVLTTTDVMKLVVVLLVILGVAFYAMQLMPLFKDIKKNWLSILAVVLLAAAIPFATTTMCIIAPTLYYHTLMRGSWSLLFVFVLAVAERVKTAGLAWKVKKASVIAACLCAFLLVFEFAKMANIVAFNMQERYEKNYALCIRIVQLLEQTKGYEHGDKVAILGGGPNLTNYPSTDITKEDLVGYFGADGDYSLNSTSKYAAFMSHYMNVTLQTIDYEEELKLAESEAFKAMARFPDKACVEKIGDVWVVKLNG